MDEPQGKWFYSEGVRRGKIGRQTKGVVFLLSLEKKFFISNSIKYCVDLFCGMFFFTEEQYIEFPG